jgi:menaquinone-dependent protoporphyrinogen oxidase
MQTSVIFATSHGTTQKVTEKIREHIGETNCAIYNLKDNPSIDLSNYQRVIIGGSIYAGTMQKKVKEFCNANIEKLIEKRLGLFICGMNEPAFEEELKNAFPEKLLEHASSKKAVGGEFVMEKLNFFEKLIVKKVSGVKESVSKLDFDKIRQLVSETE